MIAFEIDVISSNDTSMPFSPWVIQSEVSAVVDWIGKAPIIILSRTEFGIPSFEFVAIEILD